MINGVPRLLSPYRPSVSVFIHGYRRTASPGQGGHYQTRHIGEYDCEVATTWHPGATDLPKIHIVCYPPIWIKTGSRCVLEDVAAAVVFVMSLWSVVFPPVCHVLQDLAELIVLLTLYSCHLYCIFNSTYFVFYLLYLTSVHVVNGYLQISHPNRWRFDHIVIFCFSFFREWQWQIRWFVWYVFWIQQPAWQNTKRECSGLVLLSANERIWAGKWMVQVTWLFLASGRLTCSAWCDGTFPFYATRQEIFIFQSSYQRLSHHISSKLITNRKPSALVLFIALSCIKRNPVLGIGAWFIYFTGPHRSPSWCSG